MGTYNSVYICCCHSYSHQDTRMCKELEKQLANLINSQQVILWHPQKIRPGEVYAQETAFQIATADIVLLLLSPDFFASQFCLGQMSLALSLFYLKQTRIIPILIRPSDWENSPIFHLEPLPRDRKPISAWYKQSKREQVFLDIVRSIRSIVEQLYTTPYRRDDVLEKGHKFVIPFVPGMKSTEDFQHIGRFLPISGLLVSGKYRIHGLASDANETIPHYSPLGIPGCAALSVTIDTSDCAPNNIEAPKVREVSPGGLIINSKTIEANLSYEVAGNICIQY